MKATPLCLAGLFASLCAGTAGVADTLAVPDASATPGAFTTRGPYTVPADDSTWSVVNVGLRTHASNKTWTDTTRVFGNGDLGYKLGYEFHNDAAFWQLGLAWTPNATGRPDTDSALTPEMNLVFKDQWVRAGIGALDDYISTHSGTNDGWQNIYWQFILGLGIPLGRVTLDAYTYYPFSGWNRLDNFDFGDLEYGVSVGFRF